MDQGFSDTTKSADAFYLKLSPGQKLLQPWLSLWLGRERLIWFNQLDWETALQRFENPELTYPDYYTSPNFHGIQDGYLNAIAAITYDPVTKVASPPHEGWLRRRLLSQVQGQPSKILDLGCGTGSSTLLLKQTFPQATVVGLDLSPYMLVMGDYKARQTERDIVWCHGRAEAVPWEDGSFDLVTASFLFHEMPPIPTQAVLKEALRVLKPGGQVLILDGSQRILRHLGWIIDLFREPYSRVFATGCLQRWLEEMEFVQVRAQHIGLIHQITLGYRSE